MKPLKSVFIPLALLSATLMTSAAWAEEAALVTATPDKLQWTPAPSVGPGAMIAVIEGDLKAAEPYTFRLKVPANLTIGVHTHPVAERVTVLSGTFYFATGDKADPAMTKAYQAGDILIIPANMPMYASTKDQEVVVQLHGTGPWGLHYPDPVDDPRNQ